MDARVDPTIPEELREVVITRTFDAPRALVWRAWTEPDHIRAWWGPHGFDAPHPSVDLQVGGKINFDMRAPNGMVQAVTATIRELDPPKRLVMDQEAMFGASLCVMRDEITLAEADGKTRVTLRITLIQATADMLPGLKGQAAGWSQSFDKMAEHLDLERWMRAATPGADGTTFVLPPGEPVVATTRTIDAPRERV